MDNTTLSSYMAHSRAKLLIRRLLPLLIICCLVTGVFVSRKWWMPIMFSPSLNPTASSGGVAAAAVSEFYTLNYVEGMHQWAKRVCALSTEDGCQITKSVYGPIFWEVVASKKVSTQAEVNASELVYEESHDLAETQVWKLSVTLSDPWEGIEPTQTVYAQVMRQTNLEPWKFVRILFEQEVANLTTSTEDETK